MVLRPGGVSRETLQEFLGEVLLLNEKNAPAPGKASPGLLSKHYSPRAKLFYFLSDNPDFSLPYLNDAVAGALSAGQKVGLLLAAAEAPALQKRFPQAEIVVLGSAANPEEIAGSLYAGLRRLDEKKVDIIFTRDFGAEGIGLAIRDRLTRAAYEVVRVGK